MGRNSFLILMSELSTARILTKLFARLVIGGLVVAPLVACGGGAATTSPASTASTLATQPPVSAAPTAASSRPAASTAVARTYAVEIPTGWYAVELTPEGLRDMATRLESTWPAVSQALETAANGGPTPFQSGQTLLAYDMLASDLAEYPTGFNIAETGGDVGCSSRDLAAEFKDSGIQDVELFYPDSQVGRLARISGRITGGPQDLLGETYVVTVDGRTYQPYFETLWSRRGRFQPIFDAIVRSFRVTVPAPTVPPTLPFASFPHDDLQLEALLPQHALRRPLCTWSFHGAAALSVDLVNSELLRQLLLDLGLRDDAFTLGVAGRVNDADPRAIVGAYQFAGLTETALRREFTDWPGETRRVGGKTVYVVKGADATGHAEGLDYFYPVGNVIFHIKTPDERWFEDVLAQLP